MNLRVATPILFLVGVVLRVVSAMRPDSFWFDEQSTLYFSKLALGELLFLDNHPPTFLLLLKLWTAVLGETSDLAFLSTEQTLRLLPLLISILSLGLFFRFSASPFARLFMAINPASVFFASELRHHSLFELSTVFFVFQAAKIWNSDATAKPWLFFASCLAVLASHFIGIILLVAFFALLVLRARQDRKRQFKFGVGLLIALSLGFLILEFWIKLPLLHWMQPLEAMGPSALGFHWRFLSDPIWVIGSYSRLWAAAIVCFLAASIYVHKNRPDFFSVLFFAYLGSVIAVDFAFDLVLGYRKFLVPGHVLMCLGVGVFADQLVFNPSKKWFSLPALPSLPALLARSVLILGALISSKKIVEDFSRPRASWKEAAQRECPRGEREPLFIYGHPAMTYYIDSNCAELAPQLGPGNFLVLGSFDEKHSLNSQWVVVERRRYGANAYEPVDFIKIQRKSVESK